MEKETVIIHSDDDDCIPVAQKIVKRIKEEILIDDDNTTFTRKAAVPRYIYSSDSEVEELKVKKRKRSSSDSDFVPIDVDSDIEIAGGTGKKKSKKRKSSAQENIPRKKVKLKQKNKSNTPAKSKTKRTPAKKKTNKAPVKRKQKNQKQQGSKQKNKVKKETSQVIVSDIPIQLKLESELESPKCENMGNKKALPKHAAMLWTEAELLSDLQEIEVEIAQNVINLLDTDNTIPFIARYRKELTGNMEAEKLRHVRESYEHIKTVKQKATFVMNTIAKMGKLTPELERSIKCCRSLNEIEHFYAPYKTGRTGTLADRARKLGLEAPAMAILNGDYMVACSNLVRPGIEGLSTIQDVITGCQHIIADAISKDEILISFVRDLRKKLFLQLESSKAHTKKATPAKGGKNGSKASTTVSNIKKGKRKTEDEESKFENYFKFSANVNYIKPHQILAIHRGETLKVLSVKIPVPEFAFHRIFSFCKSHWLSRGQFHPFRATLLEQSCKDAYNRLIEPLIVRQIRSELLQKAECAAIEVFASNLKALLLASPLRGKTILGIDPGFRNGCKLAVISSTGEVLQTDIIFPHTLKVTEDPNAQKLRNIITTFGCDIVALGNGTACRETEEYLSQLISRGLFKPLDVSYLIVNEQGASIYSCSPEAKKEFPDMDPNLISAVSLARRLQDPMAELVKVEPKHLGVGMYQHDVPEKKLTATLHEIVSECVSFVGVDINTASECILRHIAGLNSAKVKSVIEWRSTRGPFINRNQLKLVKGVGSKTFEQCAGFIRVMPQTLQVSETRNLASFAEKPNVLDQTWIHPESYGIVERFLKICCATLDTFGTPEFIKRVHDIFEQKGLIQLSNELECSDSQLQLIVDALQKPPGHDLRCNSDVPLFRKSVSTIESLQEGQLVTGCVRNVTHFGAFIDIGVGRDGLIHISSMKGAKLSVGQKVEAGIISVDLIRKRISLELQKVF